MKKCSLLVFPVCILLLGLLGCATPVKQDDSLERLKRTLNSRIGHHISGVIQTAGPPTQITDDEAGGQIYIWMHHDQEIVRLPYTVDSPQQQTPTSKQKTTRGQVHWNPIFNRWEYKSETKTVYPEKSFSDRLSEMQTRTKYRTEIVPTITRIMFYTRADGTIYHWLVIEPNLTYAYNNRENVEKEMSDYNKQGNTQKEQRDYNKQENIKKESRGYRNPFFAKIEVPDYNKQENTKEKAPDYNDPRAARKEKRQYLEEIKRYDSTIYLFPDDAKAYFHRGYAKYKIGQPHEAKLDLLIALELAIQKDDVKLKNSIEETLRKLP